MAGKVQVESMRNPFCALKGWQQGALERAEARGGWSVFWFYMTAGLCLSLFMFALTGAFRLLSDAPTYLSPRERLFIDFVGGMLFGFVMWVLHLSRRGVRPAARR